MVGETTQTRCDTKQLISRVNRVWIQFYLFFNRLTNQGKKNPNLAYYSSIAVGEQMNSSNLNKFVQDRTRVADLTSYNDNRYPKRASICQRKQ